MDSIQAGAQYIRQCRTLGFSDAEIIQTMQSRDWQTADVNAALMSASAAPAKKRGGRLLWIILIIVVLGLVAAVGVVSWLVLTPPGN